MSKSIQSNGAIDKSCGILFVLRKETISGDRRCLHLPNLLLYKGGGGKNPGILGGKVYREKNLDIVQDFNAR